MEKESKLMHYWHKTWHFIWHDNSLLSWVVNLVLAFIFIKYLIYPTLGTVLGTDFPIVAVVSGSMEHKITKDPFGQQRLCSKTFNQKFSINFDDWWNTCGPWYTNNFGIIKEQFIKFSFRNGFNTGDIMILYSPEKINIGDVIVFNSYYINDPIIHRVVGIEDNVFITKGDHNSDRDKFINPLNNKEEIKIKKENIVGKAMIRIPFLGWIKILFVELLKLLGVV